VANVTATGRTDWVALGIRIFCQLERRARPLPSLSFQALADKLSVSQN
jgi:hypothetical protein